MGRLVVSSFAVSIDGYSAGPDQGLENPLGVGGPEIMQWFFHTRTWRQMHGEEGGSTDLDDQFAQRGFRNFGAWILGRNMFGPIRGPWPDGAWKGWWGDDPPYHVPTFVLTHHARDPVVMKGGTTFHFVTDGIENAFARAREAAQGKDVRLGGGPDTIRQFWRARLLDELHLVQMPVLLGRGESLFEGLDARALGYECTERVATPIATHIVLTRKP
jgi:dihydrofolate reductase